MTDTLTKKCSYEDCSRRNEKLPLEEFYKSKGGRFGRRAMCKKCFHKRNAKTINRSAQKRKFLLENLPNTLNKKQKVDIYESFNYECALTGEKDNVPLDHFVPLSWGKVVLDYGIGGTTFENLVPLSSTLNNSKSANNPFIWIEKAKKSHGIDMNRWTKMVAYMAFKNNMTPETYENRISACYEEVRIRRAVSSIRLRNDRRGNVMLYFIKDLLVAGINIEVAVELYGNNKVKALIKSERAIEQIIKYKNELAPDNF